jgi:hypothetical protein
VGPIARPHRSRRGRERVGAVDTNRDTGYNWETIPEISSASTKSFDDAIALGVARAAKTLKNVKGARVKEQKVIVQDGKVAEYRVDLKVTFVLED